MLSHSLCTPAAILPFHGSKIYLLFGNRAPRLPSRHFIALCSGGKPIAIQSHGEVYHVFGNSPRFSPGPPPGTSIVTVVSCGGQPAAILEIAWWEFVVLSGTLLGSPRPTAFNLSRLPAIARHTIGLKSGSKPAAFRTHVTLGPQPSAYCSPPGGPTPPTTVPYTSGIRHLPSQLSLVGKPQQPRPQGVPLS